MSVFEHPPVYHTFLLRLWEEATQDGRVWRFSLEDLRTGERRGFADLERLVVFLQEQVRHDDDTSPSPTP